MITTSSLPTFFYGSSIALLAVALAMAVASRSKGRGAAAILALVLVGDVAYEGLTFLVPGAIYASRITALLFMLFCLVAAVLLSLVSFIREPRARLIQRITLGLVAVVFTLELMRPIATLLTGGTTPPYRSFAFLLATFELLVSVVAIALLLRVNRAASQVTPERAPAEA